MLLSAAIRPPGRAGRGRSARLGRPPIGRGPTPGRGSGPGPDASPEALEEVAVGPCAAPEDPESDRTPGDLIRVEAGDFEAGLVNLKVAEGPGARLRRSARSMARALLASLGRHRQAAEVWSRLIQDDPLDAGAYLGLAEARRSLGEWDRALAALEEAAALVEDRSPLLRRMALAYASCLVARPDRLPRSSVWYGRSRG